MEKWIRWVAATSFTDLRGVQCTHIDLRPLRRQSPRHCWRLPRRHRKHRRRPPRNSSGSIQRPPAAHLSGSRSADALISTRARKQRRGPSTIWIMRFNRAATTIRSPPMTGVSTGLACRSRVASIWRDSADKGLKRIATRLAASAGWTESPAAAVGYLHLAPAILPHAVDAGSNGVGSGKEAVSHATVGPISPEPALTREPVQFRQDRRSHFGRADQDRAVRLDVMGAQSPGEGGGDRLIDEIGLPTHGE